MADRIRYYTDEQVAKAVVRGRRRRGVDVLSAPEAGMLNAADDEHLELARQDGRVIFTQDDDFLRLDADDHEHAGIAYATQQHSIGAIVAGLMLIHDVLTPDEMENRVEYL